jgi:hypothetical protein
MYFYISNTTGPKTSGKSVVNLTENKCECKDFYHYQLPCSYAIAVARYLEIDPLTLFDTSYAVRVYCITKPILGHLFLYQFRTLLLTRVLSYQF